MALSVVGSTIGKVAKNFLTKQTSNPFLSVHVQSGLPGLVLDIFTAPFLRASSLYFQGRVLSAEACSSACI